MSGYKDSSGVVLVWSKRRDLTNGELDKVVNRPLQSIDGGAKWQIVGSKDFSHSKYDDGWKLLKGIEHANGEGLHLVVTRSSYDSVVKFSTDTMPSQRVYWWSDDDFVLVASSLALIVDTGRILGKKFELDFSSMSELITSSHVFSALQTPIVGVQALGANQSLVVGIESGVLKIIDGGTPFSYSKNLLSWDDSVKGLREALEGGLKRFSGARVAVLLSGGADSRINAAAAVSAGLTPEFFTFGKNPNNQSDFRVATQAASVLGAETRLFTTTSENFRSNWRKYSRISNWSNDGLWSTARIPEGFWEVLEPFDVVIRGDGDGVYGWKGSAANVIDVLHQIELTPPSTASMYGAAFADGVGPLDEARTSHQRLTAVYEDRPEALIDLKNIAYQSIREPYGIGPVAEMYGQRLKIETPLLWRDSIEIARRLPKNRRTNKQVIFGVLESYGAIAKVPYSTEGSWDDRVEHLKSGAWAELIDYVSEYSPWPVRTEYLRSQYLTPPVEADRPRKRSLIKARALKLALNTTMGRKLAFKFRESKSGSSMSQKLLIRLAIASDLNRYLR